MTVSSTLDKRQFFLAEMVAALCLWEAVLNRQRKDQQFKDWCGLHGSYAMRRAILDITHKVEALWVSMPFDYQNYRTFDYEFCSDVIEHCVDWGRMEVLTGMPVLHTNSKELLLARHALSKQFNPEGPLDDAGLSWAQFNIRGDEVVASTGV